ncbi:hypothetical protein BO94DRAFT_209603 [Aspergillus sclerotioniger CBS 115572]|uniref:Uncharacterized protein n=1 Tax=Aspergillus sclerotioniger CBS 115572 TaxID=1450535 RepID=A0A317VTH6_9EURO|nr:hypothetical protein BO94DRAFT_209603 [Aspergillus sclerotioniger CBS 115572]PWY76148.1 hypothetical protein BO94DRAFT_209603 [Aspergillus sclerotioniger CBS 115572]
MSKGSGMTAFDELGGKATIALSEQRSPGYPNLANPGTRDRIFDGRADNSVGSGTWMGFWDRPVTTTSPPRWPSRVQPIPTSSAAGFPGIFRQRLQFVLRTSVKLVKQEARRDISGHMTLSNPDSKWCHHVHPVLDVAVRGERPGHMTLS